VARFGVFGAFQTVSTRSSVEPRPEGKDFSVSCSVTSRNTLIHNAETNVTKSPRFGADDAAKCHRGMLAADLGGSLATANFREYPFYDVG
jgi:hypothetical protein